MTIANVDQIKKHFRRKKVKLKNVLFVLPSAFTLAGVFCGFYAIVRSLTENNQEALYQAAIAIFFAGFFDMFDGRVARLTKTQTDFGVQLDSLADMVSFGVAPAVVVYKWALLPLGSWGFFAAFFFLACGAVRLARFNVMAARSAKPSKFFTGLPIPLAASMLIILVVAHFKIFGNIPVQRNFSVLLLMFFLGLLMVSNVPYWSFKDAKLDVKTVIILLICVGIIWWLGTFFPVSLFLVLLLSVYIIAGFSRWI
ncbi:MAG: CDP-diacylglycerol--serine O-phosphatidyltransferase, partial [bacterium]|nr:CDP-diacylglycerol--serine O-phosphatidyltransferase [bacterium]